MESWVWFWKPLIQSVFVCSIYLSIMPHLFPECFLLGTGHQRTARTSSRSSLATYSVCSPPLPCHPLPGLWFAGHDVVLVLVLVTSEQEASLALISSLDQRWGPDAWWDLPHRCLIFARVKLPVLVTPVQHPGKPSWDRVLLSCWATCHAASSSPHPLWRGPHGSLASWYRHTACNTLHIYREVGVGTNTSQEFAIMEASQIPGEWHVRKQGNQVSLNKHCLHPGNFGFFPWTSSDLLLLH